MSQGQISELKLQAEKLEKELTEHLKLSADRRPKTQDKNGEDLIDFLETKLEQIEQSLAQSTSEYEQLQQDCLSVQDRLNQGREKYKRAALLLTEFLSDVISKKTNILTSSNKQASFNLTSEIEDMSREDKIELMFTLL